MLIIEREIKMDIETFAEYYMKPISMDEEQAPLPQIFKDISVLKITPEENIQASRKTYTFINKNLDIITVPHEAYLYVITNNTFASETDASNRSTISIPSTTGLIDGFDFMINDTTVCTQNNSLPSTLYAVNNGLYAGETRQLDHIGLSDPNKSPLNIQKQKYKSGGCEWIIPLKFFVPFLKDNKVLWGVKQTLKITKADIANILYKTDDGSNGGAAEKVEISSIELRMPYVKLENQKQIALWNQMYNTSINRYWLDVDQFWSSPVKNDVGQSNSTFRVATKGLNSKPRYLLLHAVNDNGTNVEKHKPMGFGTDDGTKYQDNFNTIRFKKLRVKINGIYIDNGDVMEFFSADAGGGNDVSSATASATVKPSVPETSSPWVNYREYARSYDDYCKFFGQYYSKRASVKSFTQWLSEQLFVFDLNNIDNEQIFQNSGNALIIEIEYSTYKGSSDTTHTFKLVANVLYDKQMLINHSENKAVITLT